MKTFLSSSLMMALLLSSRVMAGHNCKCQDPSGTGPQWNDLTNECCNEYDTVGCDAFQSHYPGPNHQCSAPDNCLNSGNFDLCCRQLGAPGAYCWD